MCRPFNLDLGACTAGAEHADPTPLQTIDPSILDLVAAGASRAGSRPAVSDESGTLTYPELLAAAHAVAESLRTAGAVDEELVLVEVPLCRWAIPAMLGVLLAGGAYVPVDERLPANRRAAVRELTSARFRISLGEDGLALRLTHPAGEQDVEITAGGTMPAACASDGDNRPAYVMFTSGSTGRPKGVVVSRSALGFSTGARLRVYGQNEAPTFLLCSSLSFDTSVASIYWSLATGGHLVIPSRFPGDVGAIRRAAFAHRASHILMLPTVLDLLVEGGTGGLETLKTVIVCGEVCPPSLVRRVAEVLPQAVLWNEYGPTEATVWATVHRCRVGESPVPIGRPVPGMTAAVVGGDGHLCEAGELGELWLSGPGLASGYFGVPDAKEFTDLDGRRSYRTGDLVVRTEGGLLHYHGRVDAQVKVGGVRLELDELEHRISEEFHARVAVGVARPRSGQVELILFVEGHRSLTTGSVRRALMDHLPAVAMPRRVVAVAAIPQLNNGKLDRQALDVMAAEAASF